jgi:signal transduction histidine kinase
VSDSLPGPPLLARLPAGARAALTWCAVLGFGLVLYSTMSPGTVPVYMAAPQHLSLPRWSLALMAAAMALPGGFTRRWTLPVFGLILAELAAAAVIRERTWPFFLAAGVLLGYIAATRGPRTGTLAAVATALGCGWTALTTAGTTRNGATTVLIAFLMTAVAWLAGTSIRQRRRSAEALRAQAVTAERLRIARDVHDMVAHGLGVIAIQAGAAARVIDTQPASARAALSAIETTSREALTGLGHVLGALRQPDPAVGGTAAIPGLADIDRLAETMSGAGIRTNVHWRGARRPLPPDVELSAFRIIQESVTNVLRHSGARHCQVSVDYQDDALSIEVLDDGRGSGAAAGGGFGIPGMRERAGLLRGTFTAGPRAGGGFRVAARLPA